MICTPSNIEIETIISRIKGKRLNLQPDFQRGEVWSVAKQQKLIDTILRNWSMPPIHVIPAENGVLEVMDGQQRLASIKNFCDDQFKINGNIEPFNDKIKALHGKKYSELPDDVKNQFLIYPVSFIKLTDYEPTEPAELFERLNQPMKLTSAEQRNAYVGKTRNQIKKLVDKFEKLGASASTIGFSNSRLAYDEIIAKFCYCIEIGTLSKKIVSSDISNMYRSDSNSFSEKTISECNLVLEKFMSVIKQSEFSAYKLKMNKATIFSWFLYIKKYIDDEDAAISIVIFSFEMIRDFLKGKILNENTKLLVTQRINSLSINNNYLESLMVIFNQRASMASTDAVSIIYRDIIIYIFSRWVLNIKNEITADFELMAKKGISAALDYIYNKYSWGENF